MAIFHKDISPAAAYGSAAYIQQYDAALDAAWYVLEVSSEYNDIPNSYGSVIGRWPEMPTAEQLSAAFYESGDELDDDLLSSLLMMDESVMAGMQSELYYTLCFGPAPKAGEVVG